MKHFILAAALILPSLAFADTTSTVTGQNQSQAASTNVVQPAQIINTYGASSVKTSEQAPSQSFSSSFSPDSCASGAGGSLGTFNVGLGLTVPVSPNYCVMLRVFERLNQTASAEDRPEVKREERDAGLEILAEISPTVRAVLSRNHLLHGQAAVMSDQSGTVGLQSANTRIEATNP